MVGSHHTHRAGVENQSGSLMFDKTTITALWIVSLMLCAVVFDQIGMRHGREIERAESMCVARPWEFPAAFKWKSHCDGMVVDSIIYGRGGKVHAVVAHCQ